MKHSIEMYGYTYKDGETFVSFVHHDFALVLNWQQHLEYELGIPCKTYSFVGDELDISRFPELVLGNS